MTELDQRRRRAAYRASHRGTKEMDWLLGRYAEASLDAMTEADLAEFEVLMALPEPELQSWLLNGELPGPSELAGLVARIRTFHGLAVSSGAAGPC